MSEEKLYAVKNDEGKWMSLDGMQTEIWYSNNPTLFKDKSYAEAQSMGRKAHVVALVEEPEKVVVSPEEAKLVKNCLWTNLQDAFLNNINLLFRGRRPEDVTRLKSALTNGYTVAKEKKYRVLAPKSWWQIEDKPKYMHRTFGISAYRGAGEDSVFTQQQLYLYELNGAPFTKEEVTDDAD